MTDLLKLAERCEAATGPDRKLDCEILVALDWRAPDWEEGEPTAKALADKLGVAWLADRAAEGGMSIWRYLPRPTASLDAAMTLVPEENDSWSLMKWPQDGKPTFRATVSWTVKSSHKNASGPYVMHKPHVRRAEAATPALALCAAALRARAS
jgi:hypothetical protein